MMKYGDWLKERWMSILIGLFTLFTIEVVLLLQSNQWLGVYIGISIVAAWLLSSYIEFRKKKKFYENLCDQVEKLDQAYLLPELMEEPDFSEDQIAYELMKSMEKSMAEHVNRYKRSNKEYKEYIELWIHEVKLPIATGKMIVENHRDPVTESIEEELDKIEGYTEQALFYARSYEVEKDYLIQKIQLDELVSQAIIKNKKGLISNRIKVSLSDLDQTVYSDGKWLEFILNQILGNCIKYRTARNPEVVIFSRAGKEQVQLHIKDNGIGISDADLPRVFEKGFTGSNGRKYQKSTGIGLYLCRKLCCRLGHEIRIHSEEGSGTELILILPKGSFTDSIR